MRKSLTSALALAASAALTVLVTLATSSPALAHSQLLNTNPSDGATITEQISAVELTFNELINAEYSTIIVRGPNDGLYSSGKVIVTNRTVSQPIQPLHSGQYTVAWRVVSADGHPIDGQFRFSVSLPVEPTVTPPPKQTQVGNKTADENGVRFWPIAAGVGVVLIIGVVFVLVKHNRRPRLES